MENKYYTPTLDDFFYGLEYEFARYWGDTWDKHIFNEDRSATVLQNVKETPQYFRIKLLDKEDIESLGWEVNEINPQCHCIEFKKLNPVGQENFFKYYYLNYDNQTHRLVIDNGESYEDNEKFFQGKIKNKSEFKKLLNQLEI